MKKLTLIVSLVLGSLVACGGPPPPESPSVEPAVEPEDSDVEADVEEQVEPEEQEEAAPVSEMPPREPPRPPCHTLDKSRCSVMQGCEWYEKAGKGECRDQ